MPLDCHLMIDDPDRWAPALRRGRRASRHLPRRGGRRRPVRLARDAARGRAPGPGWRSSPAPPFEPYADLLPELDMVLVMTVEPGFGGQSFLADLMPKVRAGPRGGVARHGGEIWIQVDGGVSRRHDRAVRRGRRRRVRRRLGGLRRRRRGGRGASEARARHAARATGRRHARADRPPTSRERPATLPARGADVRASARSGDEWHTGAHVLRGRCNSEPAVTVRDPAAASGRLTWWNSWTDGESPDGRQHARGHRSVTPGDRREPFVVGPACSPSDGPTVRGRRHGRRTRHSPGARPTGAEHEGQDMTGQLQHERDAALCAARSRWRAPPRPSAEADPNPRVGARPARPRRSRGRRGVPPRRRAARTPRSTRWPRRPATAPAAARPSSPSSPATTPAAPVRARRRWSTPGCARVVLRPGRPERRVAGGGADTLRAAGVEVERRRAGRRGAARSTEAWTFAVVARPAVRHVEVRRHARRAVAPPPTAPAAGSPGRSPAPTCTSCGPSATPSLVGTGTVLADDPQLTVAPTPTAPLRDRQPLRVVMGLRAAAAASRASWTTPRRPCCCPPATRREALRWLCRPRASAHVLLEGGPTLAAAFLRAGLVDEVVAYVAPVLLGSGPRGGGRPRHPQHRPRRCASRSATSAPSARTSASAPRPPRESTDVHRHRRGARRDRRHRARRRLRRPARARPARRQRRHARRLDQRQRRLPHRRRARRRDASASTSWPRRSTAAASATSLPGAPRQPRAGDGCHQPVRRPHRAGPRRRHGPHPRADARGPLGGRRVHAAAPSSPATSSRRARSPSTASRSPCSAVDDRARSRSR